MDSEAIENIIWSTRLGHNFLGCFCSNRIPSPSKFPAAIIINEDRCGKKGTHWVALYIKKKDTVVYFDSYGKEPIPKIKEYLNKFTHIAINYNPFQSIFSQNCGYYCIYFVISMSQGMTFKTILYTLSSKSNPDSFVYHFVKNNFPIE